MVDPDPDELSPEFLKAFAEATDYADAVDRGLPVHHGPGRRAPRKLIWFGAVAGIVVAASFYPSVVAPPTPPEAVLEADMRWAVANVVTAVESYWQLNGRFPEAADLHGLLSEAVSYEPGQDSYRVLASYGSVRVEHNGTPPPADLTDGDDEEESVDSVAVADTTQRLPPPTVR